MKEIDINGNYTYSKTITVDFITSSILQVFPNPAHTIITVHLPLVQTVSLLSLYDAQSKLILRRQADNSSQIQQLDVSGLAAGVYNLIWENGQQQQLIKLVKE